MKKTLLLITIGILGIIGISKAATTLFPYQGGTGVGSVTAGDVGKALTVSSSVPFSYKLTAFYPASNPDGYITALGVPGAETDPIYSANTYATGLNQSVANGASPVFNLLDVNQLNFPNYLKLIPYSTGKLGIYDWAGQTAATLDITGLNASTIQNFVFPNQSGTFALTSDLAGFITTELDPVYSANTYATAMNQGVATTNSPTFVNISSKWNNFLTSDFLSSSTSYISTTTGSWLGSWQSKQPTDFLSSSTPLGGISSLNGLTTSTQTFTFTPRSYNASVSSTNSTHVFDLPFMYTDKRLAGQYMSNPGATTINTQGFGATVVPVATGTAASSDALFRTYPLIYYTSAAATSSNAGWISSAFTVTQSNWSPMFIFKGYTDNTTTTNMRTWVGLTSATPVASSSPALSYAMFRYDTGVGDTNWKCMTKGGSGGGTLIDTGRPYVASSSLEMMIVITSSTAITTDFYMDDVRVCSTTGTPPAVGTGLGIVANTQTLRTGAKKIGTSMVKLMSN